MTMVAIIPVDLDVTPLGTRSRLADELHGTPIVRRTVERVARCEQLDRIVVTCPPGQRDRCGALLTGTKAEIQAVDAPVPPWRALVASARKWSLDSWRGGIGGSCCFDEYTDARVIAAVVGARPAEAVMVVPPAALVFDPDLADRMITHHRSTCEESKLTFAQTPPGLSGLLLSFSFVQELAKQSIPVGWVFSYKPDSPLKDLVFQPSCYEVPPEVRYAMGRLVADTDRAVARLDRLLTEYADPDARTTGRWLLDRDESHVDTLPREIEIELTTHDPFPESVLRPRGARLERSGVISLETIERLVDEWLEYDDGLIVFGGFGDPLRFPDLARALAIAVGGLGNSARGLCLRTTGADLDEDRMAALLECPPDVVTVTLDAWSEKTYAALHTPMAPSSLSLESVASKIDAFNQNRISKQQTTPILVAEFTKARQNMHELDAFHDGWLRKIGAVCITGACSYAGQFEDHAVVNMAPSRRTPCRRLFSRCLVLSDGRVVKCDQDFKGLHPVGNVNETPLTDTWTGPQLNRLRELHHSLNLSEVALCGACSEWHRP